MTINLFTSVRNSFKGTKKLVFHDQETCLSRLPKPRNLFIKTPETKKLVIRMLKHIHRNLEMDLKEEPQNESPPPPNK